MTGPAHLGPPGGLGALSGDRYPSVNRFALVPRPVLACEPALPDLDRGREDDRLVQRVAAALARRAPRRWRRGRPRTPVAVILRLLVVQRLYRWSDEPTEHFVGDRLIWRQFCRLYRQPVPDDTTLIRRAPLLEPATIERLNERVIELARSLQVTRGRKLRVDRTVVAANIP